MREKLKVACMFGIDYIGQIGKVSFGEIHSNTCSSFHPLPLRFSMTSSSITFLFPFLPKISTEMPAVSRILSHISLGEVVDLCFEEPDLVLHGADSPLDEGRDGLGEIVDGATRVPGELFDAVVDGPL